MNFAQIREIIDQKDEKGFPLTSAMFGVITEFRGEGVSGTGKQTKKVSIRDDNNELHNVTLRGTLPPVTLQNQRAQFSLSSFNGFVQATNQSYIGYSGFWNSRTTVNQNTQAGTDTTAGIPRVAGGPEPPRMPRQGIQQATQVAKGKKDVDWDAKEKRGHRAMCLAYAKDLVVADRLERGLIQNVAAEFVAFIWDRDKQANKPDPSIQEPQDAPYPPQDNTGIPF